MNLKIKNLFVLFLLCLGFINSYAQSFPKISIQGTLKNSNGAAAPNGENLITFRLYNQISGGAILWSEDATVDVNGGIYSHYLGSVTPLNASDFSSTLYLGVKVGNIELTPRTELSYAPYAFAVFETICSGSVGDVKHSILNPTQFAQANGSCWVPMDGRLITGSKLGILLGITNLPDGSGLFLRAQEFAGAANNDPDRTSSSQIATIQNHSYTAHNHSLNDPGHGHSFNDKFPSTVGSSYDVAGGRTYIDPNTNNLSSENNTTFNSFANISVVYSGQTETRPKNINAWIYVRIN